MYIGIPWLVRIHVNWLTRSEGTKISAVRAKHVTDKAPRFVTVMLEDKRRSFMCALYFTAAVPKSLYCFFYKTFNAKYNYNVCTFYVVIRLVSWMYNAYVGL